ncbi:MAG: alpha/beta fold hydrolase [Alphaproteobacteria bacterium]|nr:alpha/beta fold hydrolase [Alphaproteobacteria bacterium]
MKWVLSRLSDLRLIFSVSMAMLWSAALAGPSGETVAYLHPQRLIAVQGTRHLNLYCIGQGSPTVLFDSAAGDSMAVWRLVQSRIAKTTRACAYDRAGFGFSDAPLVASDAKAAVADLHRLIVAASLRTPIIYVGHSIAGLYGVLLQATYPRDVAAEVLLDPSFADQNFVMSASLAPSQRAKWFDSMTEERAQIKQCAGMQRPPPKTCPDSDSRTRPGETALAVLAKQRASRPSYLLALASEVESFAPVNGQKSLDEKEVEAARSDFGAKPLAILTHSKGYREPYFTLSEYDALERAWNEGHNRLAALSTRGSNTIVPGSSHYIQMDRPKAVIDAVLRVVADLRRTR